MERKPQMVRIYSPHGTPQDTHILTEDGQAIPRVRAVDWSLSGGGGVAKVTLHIHSARMDAPGELDRARLDVDAEALQALAALLREHVTDDGHALAHLRKSLEWVETGVASGPGIEPERYGPQSGVEPEQPEVEHTPELADAVLCLRYGGRTVTRMRGTVVKGPRVDIEDIPTEADVRRTAEWLHDQFVAAGPIRVALVTSAARVEDARRVLRLLGQRIRKQCAAWGGGAGRTPALKLLASRRDGLRIEPWDKSVVGHPGVQIVTPESDIMGERFDVLLYTSDMDGSEWFRRCVRSRMVMPHGVAYPMFGEDGACMGIDRGGEA